MTPTYHIVSHSHWDREWYKSFEQFRSMLVNMVDDLLDLLHRDARFRFFTLDGQTVVLEDYLAVRPERGEEIRRLVAKGRIVTGPWYILPDEFLVSAEATVRNLLVGTRMAREFGGTMKVGYIPDSFGHIAMMPAILKGFDIDAALVYRGFGGEPGETTSEYWWTSPDGSRALLVHLFRHGYSAGYFHQESNDQIVGRFTELKAELDARATTTHRLLMNGGDHHWPDPKLPETLDLLGTTFDGDFEQSTVQRYVDAVRKEVNGIPEVTGEFRFGYRYAFAVMGGVYSSRMYLKQANWKTQNLLQRYVEPLNAFATAAGMRSQMPLVHQAWKNLMQNHPHDSICGCSIDQVHRDMMTRFKAADDIGASVMEFSLNHLVPYDDLASKDDRYLFFFNPSHFLRTEVARAQISFFRQDVVVGLNPDVKIDPKLPPAKGFILLDAAGHEVPYQILSREEGFDITYTKYNYPKQIFADTFTVLVDVAAMPPLGFKGLRIEQRPKIRKYKNRVRSGRKFLENAYVRVDVSRRGEVTVKDKKTGEVYKGLNVFEDSGDVGDEYNYSYPKRDLRIRSQSKKARVTRMDKGPLRASLSVEVTMRVPESASTDRKRRSSRKTELPITTVISLTPHSRRVDFETRVDNRVKDHRLRVLFPAGIRTDKVYADSQFCVVERRQKEYDIRQFSIEHPARVAPMQRFVSVMGKTRALTIFSYGLPEYELLLDGKGTFALTLLRCVGILGAGDLITRPGGKAGWHNETPEAQCPGVHNFRYAVFPHNSREFPDGPVVQSESERFHLPPFPIRRKNTAPLSLESSFVSLTEGPLTLSAVKEAEDGKGIVVRVYNPGELTATGVLSFGRPVADASLVKLNEEKIAPTEVREGSTVNLSVPPRSIASLKARWSGRAP